MYLKNNYRQLGVAPTNRVCNFWKTENEETTFLLHEKLIVETINKRKGCNCHLYKISREKYSF